MLRACVLLTVTVAAAVPGIARADTRFYLTSGLGVQFASALHLVSGDTDRPSRCDEFINPAFAAIPGCTAADRSVGAVDAWQSRFRRATGVVTAAAFGYRVASRIRVEAEYLGGTAEYGEWAPLVDPSGVLFTSIFGAEMPLAHERVGGVITHALFANAHVDFPTRTRLTPSVGFGAGAGVVGLDYGVIWARDLDPATIDYAAGLPNEAEVRQLLAGSVTTTQASLRDTLGGYQVLAGVDIAFSQSVALAVTGRWTRFSRFIATGSYDRLRSHESGVRRDGSEPVIYTVTTRDIGLAGVNLSLKYNF